MTDKPYVWAVEPGKWFMARGKTPLAALKSAGPFPTWEAAMDHAHSLIAHEPS